MAMSSETTHPITAGALSGLAAGKSMLLSTFKFVPDDKLDWTPSPGARSALRLAAHCAVSNFGMAGLLRGEPMSISTFAELAAMMDAEEVKITTREQALAAIEASTESAREAIMAITPNRFETVIGSGDLMGPTMFFMNLVGLHMSMHAAQIDYIQTCYGDKEPHFGQ